MNALIRQQIRIVWCAQLIIVAALEMSNPFLPLYLNSLSSFLNWPMPLWNTFVYLAPLVAAIIFSPLWGHLGDKVGHKKMLLRAACAISLIQASLYFVTNIELFIGLRFVQGGLAGFVAAAQTYAMTLVATEYRAQTLGHLQVATALGIALGPVVGGGLATVSNYHVIFLVSTFLTTTTCLLIYFKLKEGGNSIKITVPLPSAPSKKFNLMNSYFLSIFFSIFLAQMAKFLPQSFYPLYFANDFAAGPLLIGFLYALPAFGLLFFATRLGQFLDKFLHRTQKPYIFISSYFIVLFLVAALASYLHAVTLQMSVLILARILWGIALAGILPGLFSLLCLHKKEGEGYGRLIGFANSSSKFGNLAGVLSGGVLYQLVGFSTVFYWGSLIYLSLAALFLLIVVLIYLNKKNDLALL